MRIQWADDTCNPKRRDRVTKAVMTARLSHIIRQHSRTGAAKIVLAFEASLEAVPPIIVAGLVAFSPLGDGLAGIGIAAAFLGAVIASALLSVIADRRGLIGGPSLGLALMVSAALETLIQRGLLTPASTGTAMALSMALTLGCGLLTAGVAALGVGRVAPLVPYPVLAGLRNGTAVLLVLEQVHTAVGMPAHGHGSLHLGALAVTAVTVLATLWRMPRLRAIPPVIVALVAGVVTHHALALLPWGHEWVGALMAPMLPGSARLPALNALLPALPFSAVTEVLVPTAISMTILGVLETVACASALQSETGERSGGRRDLYAVAFANIAGGLLGALPAAGSMEETVPAAGNAARHSRVTALLRCGFLVVVALLAMPLLAKIPAAVLAGLIIAAAWHVADLSSLSMMIANARAGRVHRIEGIGNLLVMTTVAAVAATLGLVTAVMVGIVLSLAVFVADMARGPVRRRYTSPLGRSRAHRGDRQTETLLQYGQDIEVIELQGALFFGSADQVAGELQTNAATRGRYIVLDMHRIHRMDLSGARSLLAACERIWRGGKWLVLAGMRPGVPAWDYLADHDLLGGLPPGRVFPTLEDAIESTEQRLLSDRLGIVKEPVLTGAEALVSLGIPNTAVAGLLRPMAEVAFASGAPIIRAGETSRDMFILLEGCVDVTLRVHAAGAAPERSTRLATLAPGTLFGEMALLSSAPRSADLTAHGMVRCLRLDLDGLNALRAEDPDNAWHLLTAIATRMDLNLRLANAAIASYEE